MSRSASVCIIALLCSAFQWLSFVFLNAPLRRATNIDTDQGTAANSLFFFGAALGTWALTALGDVFGRLPATRISIVGATVLCIVTAFVQNYAELIIVRLFHGFFAGGVATTSYVILAEWTSAESRGRVRSTGTPFFRMSSQSCIFICYLRFCRRVDMPLVWSIH